MKIYLINLDKRTDRMAFMQAQLDRLGITFTRIPAIDGTGGRNIGYSAGSQVISKPEFACALSHVKCWQEFVRSGDETCMILEDDAVLSVRLPAILADMSYFRHGACATRLETTPLAMTLSKQPVFQKNGLGLYRMYNYIGGAAAYVLSKDFARHLISEHGHPKDPPDDILFKPFVSGFRPYFTLQMDPAPCTQHEYLETAPDQQTYASDLYLPRAQRGQVSSKINFRHKLIREIMRPVRKKLAPYLYRQRVVPFADT